MLLFLLPTELKKKKYLYFQIWYNNDGLDPKNKLTFNEYYLKSIVEITKNESPMYNLRMVLDAVIRYSKLHRSMFGKYQGELMRKPSDFILNKASGTLKDFLERENLQLLAPFFLILQTGLGYGDIDNVAALYGLMWNTPSDLLSAAINVLNNEMDQHSLVIFKKGYQKVIDTIVNKEKFDIRFNVAIQNIVRTERDVTIHYKSAHSDLHTKTCGFLIWSAPMPQLLKSLSNPTQLESDLFTTMSCDGLISTMMRGKGTIRNMPITFYRENLGNMVDDSVIADADIEGILRYCKKDCQYDIEKYNSMYNVRVMTTLQILRNVTYRSGPFGEDELETIKKNAKNHYEKYFNTSDIEILSTFTAEYFYRWNPYEVQKRNPWKVFAMQGNFRTWYIGASVSFESVDSVMEYNKLLLRQFESNKISPTSTPPKNEL